MIGRMDKNSGSTSDSADIPCDISMKIALIGDSGILLLLLVSDM